MSIWRDIYLAMPKGERYEFAKRTLSVPHVNIQAASDLVIAGREEHPKVEWVPPGVVAAPWSECGASWRMRNSGIFARVTCERAAFPPDNQSLKWRVEHGQRADEMLFFIACEFWFTALHQSYGHLVSAPPYITTVVLDSGGRVEVSDDAGVRRNLSLRIPASVRQHEKIGRNILENMTQATWAILTAFGLAHCKNVKVEETTEPAPKCVRREGFPDAKVTYRTLAIGGPAKSARKRLEEDAEEASIQRALHICRGHFAEYGPEAPLFGKHVGQFWVPQHVRGTEKAGRVVKDYEVKKPTGDA